jgi:hypothetical protein
MWKATPILVVLAMAASNAAAQTTVTPPAVPSSLSVPDGYTAFAIGRATGTQNYICMPSGKNVAWTFLGPQATLFGSDGDQFMTHYLSPNPDENNTARATWRHSRDTSTVWAVAIASYSSPDYVEAGAIPWLLLRVVGSENGPTFGDRLSSTAYIQRVNTSGGVAPASGCRSSVDVGKRAMVPYTTDYVFYR